MSQEEIIQQLQTENAQLKEEKEQAFAEKAQALEEKAQALEENRHLREQVEELSKRLYEKTEEAGEKAELLSEKQHLQSCVEELSVQVHGLLGRVAKNSSNSSKPPSTDGYAKKTRSLRQPTGKKPGGQVGHQGSTRSLVETPDEIIILREDQCARCQTSLEGVGASGCERRQRVDLPEIKAQVTEYQAQDVPCPHCQHVSRGTFPDEFRATVQFGPMVKGVALYLLYGQLLPYARTAELLSDLCGCPISPGTLEAFVAEGADRLIETEELIKQALRDAEVDGTDETSLRILGLLYWLHVVRTDLLTHYAVHRKRGKAATDAIGILPDFHGIMEHDSYNSYPQYRQCKHALCNAHPLRELRFFYEHEKQEWAKRIKEHLLFCLTQVEEARARGETCLPANVIEQLTATYHKLIKIGLAAQPPPPPQPKKKGRVKQTKAKNLLDRLQRDAASFLLFLSDFRVPFTNNGSEQDLRMVKVQQKISGTFRSEAGPVAFCRIRGYFSTMAKQGYHLCSVARQIFAGVPLSPVAARLPFS
jgi:transposase